MKFTLASAVTFAALTSAVPTAPTNPCSLPSGAQVLRYPGFESGNGFSTQSEGGGLFYSRIVTPGRHSRHALANTLNSDGGVAVGILTQNLNTCDGDEYTYSIDYKFNQYGTPGRVAIAAFAQYGQQGEGPPTVILPSSTNAGSQGQGGNGVWATQSATFTAQNHLGAGTLIVQISSEQNSNVTVRLDNISITKN